MALEYKMKQGKGQENTLVITPSSKNTRDDSIDGHLQMINTEIRLIILFAAKDGQALYSQ